MREFGTLLQRPAAGLLLAGALCLAPLAQAGDPRVLPVYDPAAPLTADGAVERRTLANGLEVVVAPHANPPGQVAIRVLVGAGSLSEEPDQVGAAYLAPRLLFARARSTPTGERLATNPGAFEPPAGASSPTGNSGEHAWLALTAPASNAADLAEALRFVAEFLSAGEFDETLVARFRPQVQDEARRTETKADRIRRVALPALTPNSLLTERVPFPAIEDLCETDSVAVARFIRSRYAPMNTTVVVVGDAEPATVFALASRELANLPSAPIEPAPRLTITPRPRAEAVVTADPEAPCLIAELIVTTPATGPARTAQDARGALAVDLARAALERRLTAALDEPETPLKEVNAWAGDVGGPMFIGVATATGDTARWRSVASTVADSMRSLAQRGVSESELDAVRRAHLAKLEDAARTAADATSAERALQIVRAEATGAVYQSPAQRCDTARRLLPFVTAEEVSRAAAERFDPSVGTLLLVFPTDAPTPSVSEARRAMEPARTSEKPAGALVTIARAEAAPEVNEHTPAAAPQGAGSIAEISVNPDAGITSAWLSNGVRVHYRETPDAGGQIAFAISLIGGRDQEDLSTRGLTLSTQALWGTPATPTIPAADMRERMDAIPLRLLSLIETDRVLIEFAVPGEHAQDALELVAKILEAPRVDAQALERWKWGQLRRDELNAKGAIGVLGAALERAVFPPDDPRIGALSPTEVQAITLRASQAWAEHLCGGPIEIGVAGDLRAALALETIASTLGRLTPRPRPVPTPFPDDAPRLLQPVGDPSVTVEYGRPNDPAGVLVSIAGADDKDPVAMAHMAMQAQILLNAITQRATVERALAQRIFVSHSPGTGLPGSGLLTIRGLTEPGLADLLLREIDLQIDRVASDGVTVGELAEARASALAEIDRAMTNPRYWAREYSDRTFRDRPFGESQRVRQAIEAATAADLGATLSRFDALGERVRIKAMPITTPR